MLLVFKNKANLIIFVLLAGMSFSVFGQQTAENRIDVRLTLIEYIEFREVDIKDVLRQLAKQYNLNIIFSESVEGLITVQLHNVTVDEALDSIITINGFVYTRKGGVIKVTTPEEAEKEGKQTRVFRLNNADAAGIKVSLSKVLTEDGSMEIDIRSNSLIVTDIPRVINQIENMLFGLDETTQQVLIEAKFIETSLGTTEQLGINWDITGELSGAMRPSTFPFRAIGDQARMDTLFGQPNPITTGDTEDSLFPSSYGFPFVTPVDFTLGTLDFSDYQMVLHFLRTRTDSKLISSPRVVTVDNKSAEMSVGKARPIPTFEYIEERGAYQVTGFEEKNEGVTLIVTPQVSGSAGNYNIKLKLTPEVTSFSDEVVSFEGLGFNYPILSRRFTNTEVIIKDGQTIVIGGLIEDKRTETVRKVPFLGDIPFLGRLFKYNNVNPNQKTELLIFVTARIVRNEEGRVLAYDTGLSTIPTRNLKLKLREIK
ncbi:MAG: secretin and TonB N-terminal domain-containing protein [Candidatus Omnitrophota bacterium]